jgi:molecular chaperone GrpE
LLAAEEEKRQAAEEWGPQLERLKKEYTQIQERSSLESRAASTSATIAVIKSLLPIADNFGRALLSLNPVTDEGKRVKGRYQEAFSSLEDVIKSFGVETIETVGLEFDYTCHDAIMKQPDTGFEEGFVCQEFQRGYKMGETLIRAAIVGVSA